MSQRSRMLEGGDLIKGLKGKKREVKWRKTVRRFGTGVIAESTARDSAIRVQFLRSTTRARTTNKMVLSRLAGLSVFVTLSFRTLMILGESVLTSEIDRSAELRVADKRLNNFGVPLEMPFDTNFWPSRGRRSRHSGICYGPDGDFAFAKRPLPCPTSKPHLGFTDRKRSLPDAEFNSPGELDHDSSSGHRDEIRTTCCHPPPPDSRGKLINAIPGLLTVPPLFGPKWFHDPSHKNPTHFAFPRLLLNENGVYWEPENLYGEKKKKQDVFWVARGKKNLLSRN